MRGWVSEAAPGARGPRVELGDEEAALPGYAYALELDPGLTDARVGRASLLLAAEALEAARADVLAGLAMDTGSAELHAAIAQQEVRFRAISSMRPLR